MMCTCAGSWVKRTSGIGMSSMPASPDASLSLRSKKPSNPRVFAGLGYRPIVATMSQQILQLAVQHHQAGRFDEAEKLYLQLLSAQPNSADALHLLGVLRHQQGRHDLAVESITKAIAANSAVAEYHGNLAAALRAQGQFDLAVASCRR